MTHRQRLGSLPGLLFLAAAALSIELVHIISYAHERGVGAGFAAAMAFGGHHGYWLPMLAATITVGSAALLKASTRRAAHQIVWRRFANLWTFLLAVGFGGFLLLENLETVHGDHPLTGFAPIAWITQPVVLAAVAAVIALIAMTITTLSNPTKVSHRATLVHSYARLVESGVYSADFKHADWASTFFALTMTGPLSELASSRDSMRILECGAGTGFWLARVHDLLGARAAELHGFDLSPDMVGAARERLGVAGVPATVATGDILDDGAYLVGERSDHDMVFAYDLVQQLPKQLQERSALAMFEHVALGGWLLIFDHDARSRYGRIMGLKKWLRRHLGIPLVPAFYVHAKYPDLAKLSRRLLAAGAESVEISVEPEGRHRALVAKRPTNRRPASDQPA